MDVKYQIFVSSTFEDLQDERRAVIAAILAMGHIPVGMEAFNASDEDQWTNIKRRIDKADYYVVIVAERYGAEKDGKSYTQMEYEYAVEQGLPVAAFLLKADARANWANHKVEHPKAEKIEAFRSLCKNKMVNFWTNSGDLVGAVVLSLTELIQLKPRIGWVRSDSVPNANVLNEIAALSEEKRVLQAKVESLELESDGLYIPKDVIWRLVQMSETNSADLLKVSFSEGKAKSMLQAFNESLYFFAQGITVSQLSWELNALWDVEIEYDELKKFVAELSTDNLIDFSARPSGTSVVNHYSLTTYGKDFVMYSIEWEKRRNGGPELEVSSPLHS